MSFGLDNLPYGVVGGRCVVRYGDRCCGLERFDDVFAAPSLNGFLARGRSFWEATRDRVTRAIESGNADLEPLGSPSLPVAVGDFVDFYASLGARHQPRAAVPPGRRAAAAQLAPPAGRLSRPRRLDRRLRHADRTAVRASGPEFGADRAARHRARAGLRHRARRDDAGPIDRAADHVFGFVLVNDWSARDLQRWEYRPLGPFLGKSFATSISPWVVPLAALEPYLVPAREQDPEPLPYLRVAGDWALDLELEVELNGEVISRGNARGLYWTFPQMLAHATVNGAALRAGDLFASGTISGPDAGLGGLADRARPPVPGRRRHRRPARRRGHGLLRRGQGDDRRRATHH